MHMSDESEKPANRGNAGKGRPRGSRNKTTLAAKEAIALAAEGLGGVQALIAWVKKDDQNERIFWSSIYPRLLPLKVSGEVEMGSRLAEVAARWLPRK
jgi:hypothetical protein